MNVHKECMKKYPIFLYIDLINTSHANGLLSNQINTKYNT